MPAVQYVVLTSSMIICRKNNFFPVPKTSVGPLGCRGQIPYFPSDLNKFFKNLEGIEIPGTGLNLK